MKREGNTFTTFHALAFPLYAIRNNPLALLPPLFGAFFIPELLRIRHTLLDDILSKSLPSTQAILLVSRTLDSLVAILVALFVLYLSALLFKFSLMNKPVRARALLRETVSQFGNVLGALLVSLSILLLVGCAIGAACVAVIFITSTVSTSKIVMYGLYLFVFVIILFSAEFIFRAVATPFIAVQFALSPKGAFLSSKFVIDARLIEFTLLALVTYGSLYFSFVALPNENIIILLRKGPFYKILPLLLILWYFTGVFLSLSCRALERLSASSIQSLRVSVAAEPVPREKTLPRSEILPRTDHPPEPKVLPSEPKKSASRSGTVNLSANEREEILKLVRALEDREKG